MPTLMVIDDDAVLCSLYDRVFTTAHFTVTQASSCAQAIQRLEQFTPEIVLVDMSLSDGSGWQVVSWMRARPRFQATRVIIVSGNRQYEDELDAYGADCFLYKPVSLDMLLSLVGRFVKSSTGKSARTDEPYQTATQAKLGVNLSTETGYVGWIANS